MGKHLQTLPLVFRAYVLEQESAPYLLSTHLTEQGAADRLNVCKRRLNPNCAEQIWMWVETVKNGVVLSKTYVDAGVESIAEANVPCL